MITLDAFDLTTRDGVRELASAIGQHFATRTLGPALARIREEDRGVFIAFIFAQPLGVAHSAVGPETFLNLHAAWLAAMEPVSGEGRPH